MGGFTLLELMAVVVIIVVLALILVGSFEQIRRRSERANCTANLRNLYAGLQAYIVQNQHWPQCPHKLGNPDYDEWWIDELAKFSINEKTWYCPTLTREEKGNAIAQAKGGKVPNAPKKIHYMPTPFDDRQGTPYRWPTQPWLMEIYGGHGSGALIIFPDGSVVSFNEFAKRGR